MDGLRFALGGEFSRYIVGFAESVGFEQGVGPCEEVALVFEGLDPSVALLPGRGVETGHLQSAAEFNRPVPVFEYLPTVIGAT